MALTRTRRRTVTLLAVMISAVLALTACARDSAGTEDAATSPSSSAGAFPATIDTAYGKVTVDEKPQKIMVLTTAYLDLLNILGERPSAWNSSFDDEKSFLEWYPWLKGTYDVPSDPALVTAEYTPAAEAIAAKAPDLILTDIWNVDEPLYAQLSKIAPTYVGIETKTQTSWQDNLTALAKLTGHDPAIVQKVESELDTTIAAQAELLPGLKGKTFQVPVFSGTPPQLWLTEFANDLLGALGLVPGNEQPANGKTNADVPPISLENIDRINADVVIVAAAGSLGPEASAEALNKLKADPRLPTLPASKNGTLLLTSSNEWSAVNGGTPASYRWWLGRIVPQLEKSTLNQAGR